MIFTKNYITSSIGKKQIVAFVGVMIILIFLIPHFIGNMFFLFGPKAFNTYAEHLHSLGILINIVEVVLLFLGLVHVIFSVTLVVQNKKAAIGRYQMKTSTDKRSLSARTMPVTGLFILIFLAVHLTDFTFSDVSSNNYIVEGKDLGLYGLLINTFLKPANSILYLIAMPLVGLHVSHSFQSAFQTFGFFKEPYTTLLHRFSILIGLILAAGFCSIPIIANLKFGNIF